MMKVGMMMYFHIFGFLIWGYYVYLIGGNSLFRKVFNKLF